MGRYFEFRIMPDFAQGQTTLFDAYWDGKFVPAFTVRAGKFKPPVGFKRLQSATDITFAERGLPTNLAPNRDVGLQLAGDISEGLFAYQVGVFDGVPDLGNGDADFNDSKDLAGRVFFQPIKRGTLKGLGFGVSGSTGNELGAPSTTAPTATGLPAYRSPSQKTVFRYRSDAVVPANSVIADGRRNRVSPHAYLGLGSLGVLGEYIVSTQEVRLAAAATKLKPQGLAGERRLLPRRRAGRVPQPDAKEPFDLKEGGCAPSRSRPVTAGRPRDDAFPLRNRPARSARRRRSGSGLDWILTKQVKVGVDYEHTTSRAAPRTAPSSLGRLVVTRSSTRSDSDSRPYARQS